MKYKVGDRVKMRSLQWCKENIFNNEDKYPPELFNGIEKFCGKILTISDAVDKSKYVDEGYYNMFEDTKWDYYWTDEMIECLVEEEKSMIREKQIDSAVQEYIDSDNAVLTYSDGFCEQTDHPFVRAAFKAGVEWADNNVTQDDCSKAPKLTSQDYSNGRFGYQLPAGFEAKLTERELILTPEKPKYPKTYEECYKIMGVKLSDCYIQGYKSPLLEDLQELLICRDAYWKIAGEEMGLGKPWKPDWDAKDNHFYTIYTFNGKIECSATAHRNAILAFPTAEMRDAFYENFKELIEQCKEFL